MSKYPCMWRLADLVRATQDSAMPIDGSYVPSRPMGLQSFASRVRCAYAVFSGKADAVVWPEDEWDSAENAVDRLLDRLEGKG